MGASGDTGTLLNSDVLQAQLRQYDRRMQCAEEWEIPGFLCKSRDGKVSFLEKKLLEDEDEDEDEEGDEMAAQATTSTNESQSGTAGQT